MEQNAQKSNLNIDSEERKRKDNIMKDIKKKFSLKKEMYKQAVHLKIY